MHAQVSTRMFGATWRAGPNWHSCFIVERMHNQTSPRPTGCCGLGQQATVNPEPIILAWFAAGLAAIAGVIYLVVKDVKQSDSPDRSF